MENYYGGRQAGRGGYVIKQSMGCRVDICQLPSLMVNPDSLILSRQKFNIPFGYHLLTVSLTIVKQIIILVKEIVTIYLWVDSL